MVQSRGPLVAQKIARLNINDITSVIKITFYWELLVNHYFGSHGRGTDSPCNECYGSKTVGGSIFRGWKKMCSEKCSIEKIFDQNFFDFDENFSRPKKISKMSKNRKKKVENRENNILKNRKIENFYFRFFRFLKIFGSIFLEHPNLWKKTTEVAFCPAGQILVI